MINLARIDAHERGHVLGAAMVQAKARAVDVGGMADQLIAMDNDLPVNKRDWIHLSEAAMVLVQVIDRIHAKIVSSLRADSKASPGMDLPEEST